MISDGLRESLNETHAAIVDGLEKLGFDLVEYPLDLNDFKAWVEKAQYDRFENYYLKGLETKHVDHYLGWKFLDLKANDVYIDVASALTSPAADIYSEMSGCEMYRQDLLFPEGIKDNIIGGDASNMPLPDGFASKLGLHSSFEHFERESDIGFIHETSRILRPGGRMVIVPMFMDSRYVIKTDPTVWPAEGMYFDEGAAVLLKDWKNRFARFYDPEHMASRVRAHLGDLKLTIYVMRNETDLVPKCDRKFVAVFEKPA